MATGTREQNYEVTYSQFGAYERGKVLPEWVVARTCHPARVAEDIAGLVERKVLRPTGLPCNVTLSLPVPKESGDPLVAVTAERNKLLGELKVQTEAAKAHKELAEIHKARLDGREKALAELTDKAADWQRLADDRAAEIERIMEAGTEQVKGLKAEIARLTEELEAATAPAPKNKTKQPVTV